MKTVLKKRLAILTSIVYLSLGLLMSTSGGVYADACVLNSAKWDKTRAADKEVVGITVTGTPACAGWTGSVHVWRDEVFDNEVAKDETKNFDSNGVLHTSWTVDSNSQSAPTSTGDYQYYIIVSAGSGAGSLIDSRNSGGGQGVLYVSVVAGSGLGGATISFDVNPKTFQKPGIQSLSYTLRLHVDDTKQFIILCQSNGRKARWQIKRSIGSNSFGVIKDAVFTLVDGTKDYNFDLPNQNFDFGAATDGTYGFVGQIFCGNDEILHAATVFVTIGKGDGPGGQTALNSWACVAPNSKYSCSPDASASATDCSGGGNTTCGGKACVQINSTDCGTTAAWACIDASGKYACSPSNKQDLSDVSPAGACTGKTAVQVPANRCGQFPGSTAGSTYTYEIKNPLAGGPSDPFDLINIASQWIFNISIPLAVMFILYAGFLMLTAGPNPTKVKSARSIITNVVIALAIIFIGRGFITLIRSVIELGGSGATQQTSTAGGPGQACSATQVCNQGLQCDSASSMCVYAPGSRAQGQDCVRTEDCQQKYACDNDNICR